MRNFLIPFRIIVGVIFIISGLIKANDPVGFSYKMEEYFTVFKTQDSVATTVFEMRELSEDEKDAVFAGTSSIIPVDFNGTPIDLSAEGARDEFMYVNAELVTYSMVERDNFWNSFCNVMHDNALLLSIFVCVIEILLGLAVIAGVFTTLTAWSLLGMIIFFCILTLYSAYYDKVTDCGCFGDALKLTPWQSFTKDVVLLVLILPLVIFPKKWSGKVFDTTEKIVSVGSIILGIVLCLTVFDWQLPAIFIIVAVLLRWMVGMFGMKPAMLAPIAVLLPTLFSIAFTVHCYYYLPKKDYRPWAIGNSIPSKMVGEPEQANIYMIYKNKETGKEVENLAVSTDENGVVTNSWEWMDSTFLATHDFVDRRQEVIKPAVVAPIHDMSLTDPATGMNYFEDFVYKPGAKLFVVTYDLSKTNLKAMPKINAIADEWMKEGNEIIGATSSSDLLVEFLVDNKVPFPYYTNDATALKTIVRSNPGLLLIQDTIVRGMWPSTALPDMNEIKSKLK